MGAPCGRPSLQKKGKMQRPDLYSKTYECELGVVHEFNIIYDDNSVGECANDSFPKWITPTQCAILRDIIENGTWISTTGNEYVIIKIYKYYSTIHVNWTIVNATESEKFNGIDSDAIEIGKRGKIYA